ncbi:MAG: S-layer homology domain-containing protein [Clostridia bacterium]|nr:S-layer homology domain-containing protein [Clostridia bacterium]
MKRKITVLMLVSAILCSISVPAVTADEKVKSVSDVKMETKIDAADAKTDLNSEPSAVDKTVTKTDVKTEKTDSDKELTEDAQINALSTAAPETEMKAEPTASERPFEVFRNNLPVSGVPSASATMEPSASKRPIESAKPSASVKPNSSQKPSASIKPNSSQKPSASVTPTGSPAVSAAPSATPAASAAPTLKPNAKKEISETQTKSVTGTVKSITDDKISITVREGVTEEYLYGAPIKDVKAGDSVMLTYDPKFGYMERVYKASEEFIEEVKFVDFTVSKLSSMNLEDSVTKGDLCGLIYNMLVYNEKIKDTVKYESADEKTEEKTSLSKAAESYLEKHPEAKDTIKVYSSSSTATKSRKKVDKNSLNILKAEALCNMGYISDIHTSNIDEKITREDAAVILAAVYSKNVKSTKSSKEESYSDAKDISAEAKNSVSLLQKAGIMTGNGKSFNPKAEYTEEDAIADIVKIEELF